MGATAMLAGTALSTGSKIYGGIQQNRAMQQSAGELQQEAGQSVASGIQGYIASNRRATYVASNAQARIAGGGLATTGTSAQTTLGRILGQGEYDARTALYQGYDRAQEIGFRASTMRNEGAASETAGWLGGISSALTGGETFASKYGGNLPPWMQSMFGNQSNAAYYNPNVNQAPSLAINA